MGGTVIKPQAQIILERGQAQGIEIGIERGKAQGIEIAKEQISVKLAEMGVGLEKIAQAAEVDLDTVREWIERKSK